MYVGLKQPRGDGERYVTPARAAAKETKYMSAQRNFLNFFFILKVILAFGAVYLL